MTFFSFVFGFLSLLCVSSISFGASQVVLVIKNLPANARDIRDVGKILRSGRSPEGGHGNPLQYPCLDDPVDRGAWWASVHRLAKSWTLLKQLNIHALQIFSFWLL